MLQPAVWTRRFHIGRLVYFITSAKDVMWSVLFVRHSVCHSTPELSVGPICSTQPNPYQSENLDPGPNPTDPIKTTNLLVQERQLLAHDVT